MDLLRTMDGPSFLAVFFVWFLAMRGVVMLLRYWGFDSPLTTLAGLTAFEGLAVARLMEGSSQGMHHWGFLIAGMILGGFFFLVRMDPVERRNSSGGTCGGSTGCGGGGTCGGGSGSSCGGGGCGGCGGS